jgi:hypothetical protein
MHKDDPPPAAAMGKPDQRRPTDRQGRAAIVWGLTLAFIAATSLAGATRGVGWSTARSISAIALILSTVYLLLLWRKRRS